MIYRDGRRGKTMVKRFPVKGITRDKEYNLTKGTEGTKILYFTANPNGEAEIVKVNLKPKPKLKKLAFEYDFSDLTIKGRSSKGNILTRHIVKNIIQREEGVSTLGARDIWYDDIVKRLNTEQRGEYLGAFKSDDKILTIMQNGTYKLVNYDLSTHFDEDMIRIEKFNPDKIISVVYLEGNQKKYYTKRFQIDQQSNGTKKVIFIGEHPDAELINISLDSLPRIEVFFDVKSDKRSVENEIIQLADFIAVKSYKARGKRISNKEIKKIVILEPLPYQEKEITEQESPETTNKMTVDTQVEEKKNDIKTQRKKETKEAPEENKTDNSQQMILDL